MQRHAQQGNIKNDSCINTKNYSSASKVFSLRPFFWISFLTRFGNDWQSSWTLWFSLMYASASLSFNRHRFLLNCWSVDHAMGHFQKNFRTQAVTISWSNKSAMRFLRTGSGLGSGLSDPPTPIKNKQKPSCPDWIKTQSGLSPDCSNYKNHMFSWGFLQRYAISPDWVRTRVRTLRSTNS